MGAPSRWSARGPGTTSAPNSLLGPGCASCASASLAASAVRASRSRRREVPRVLVPAIGLMGGTVADEALETQASERMPKAELTSTPPKPSAARPRGAPAAASAHGDERDRTALLVRRSDARRCRRASARSSRPTPRRSAQSQRWLKRTMKWRAGIEARIAALKHCFDMDRALQGRPRLQALRWMECHRQQPHPHRVDARATKGPEPRSKAKHAA